MPSFYRLAANAVRLFTSTNHHEERRLYFLGSLQCKCVPGCVGKVYPIQAEGLELRNLKNKGHQGCNLPGPRLDKREWQIEVFSSSLRIQPRLLLNVEFHLRRERMSGLSEEPCQRRPAINNTAFGLYVRTFGCQCVARHFSRIL